MVAKTVYLVVMGLLLALAYKFVAWQFVLQLALVAALCLWVFLVGIFVARKGAPHHSKTDLSPMERIAIAARAVRAEYAAKNGEDAAAQVDRTDPRFWVRYAAASKPVER